ncbi:MAG TPA: hypothetical protein VFM77_18040, partial [Terriglobales bacterium]|nr:hypothetical protein [Terriglobales bacterium]
MHQARGTTSGRLAVLLLATLGIAGCGAASNASSFVSPSNGATGSAGSTSTSSVSGSGSTPTTSPSYQNDLIATATWVRNNSVAGDGAILYGSTQINPYYSNLAAIGLTHDPASYGTVQRWMQWYISHLNWPDKWGLYGTTYDYDYS